MYNLHIERLHSINSHPAGDGDLWQPKDCFQAGITDLFVMNSIPDVKNNSAWDELCEFVYPVYGQFFQSATNIQFCQHWPEGISIEQLLEQEYQHNVFYEIDCYSLNTWPLEQVQQLCARHNLLVFDYMELGALIGPLLKRVQLFKNCVFMDSSMGDHVTSTGWDPVYDYTLPLGFTRLQIPMYLYFTSSNYQGHGFIPQKNTMEHHTLVPCFKPRQHRIDLLADMWKSGLLSKCNWSLAGNVSKPHNKEMLQYRYWDQLKTDSMNPVSKRFCSYHDRILPKRLDRDYCTENADLILLKQPNYKWHVVCESFVDRVELTEKVFQSFMLMNPALCYAGPGYGKKLRELGFRIDTPYEDTDPSQLRKNIMYWIQQEPDTTHLVHNQQLCLDNEFWACYLATNLEKALLNGDKAPTRQ